MSTSARALQNAAERAEEDARTRDDEELMNYATGVKDTARYLFDGSTSERLTQFIRTFTP